MSSTSPPLTYDLSMRQQPKHSRMCGVGSKADRRPIDPPPIVQLKVYSNLNSVKLRQDLSFNHFQSPYFFVYCSLANEHNDDELHLLSETKTRYTTGNVTSSVYCLRDLVLSEVLVAVFPDVSVRVEGRFRLKFSLFEISKWVCLSEYPASDSEPTAPKHTTGRASSATLSPSSRLSASPAWTSPPSSRSASPTRASKFASAGTTAATGASRANAISRRTTTAWVEVSEGVAVSIVLRSHLL